MLPNPLEEIARKLDEYNKRLSSLERLEGGGALVLIEDIELALAAASFDFQNIPTTYKHLLIRLSLRSARAAVSVSAAAARLNNDSGNNYDSFFREEGGGGAVVTTTLLANDRLRTIRMPAATAVADYFMTGTMYLFDYLDTNKFKNLYTLGDYAIGANAADLINSSGMGIWKDTSAINRITLIDDAAANFLADSRASLYGIR